ncbi:glycosyltransferase family 8 protein, partial [Gilliamella apis]
MENDMHYSDKFLKNILVLNKNVQVTEGYHIAYCFDDNYAMPAGLSLMSVIENNPNIAINFHLFTNNLSKQNLAHFETLAKQFDCSITCYEIDSNFSVNSDTLVLGISIATCLRFIVPEVLEKITSRVLYLDCDTLCVGNLEGLFNRDLTNKIAAVVPDIENMQNTQGKRYGIPYGEYFNAGVIFFNTLLWNHNKLTEKTFQLINDGNVYTFADQDVLN